MRYEVVGRPLTLNGRVYAKGERVNLADATGAALVTAGRLRERRAPVFHAPAKSSKPRRKSK